MNTHLLTTVFAGVRTSFTPEERAGVTIRSRRFYSHKTVKINYTTDNLRRAQDSINTDTGNIMVCSSEEDEGESDGHPYMYGRVIGVFHLDVSYTGPGMETTTFRDKRFQRMDVLWIRWYAFDASQPWGLRARRLPRVVFPPMHHRCAFGFVNPSHVIRAVHVIPSFASAPTSDPSICRPSLGRPGPEEEDFESYYVGMYVQSQYTAPW